MTNERKVWSREETIIAFNLYCKIPFRQTTKNNPMIIQFAEIINRTPSAMSMKIGNLGRLDPALKERGISGLVNGSKLDEEVWNEFSSDWNGLAFESEKVIAKLQGVNIRNAAKVKWFSETSSLPEGISRDAVVKVRVNQAFFRSAILSAYENKCCITGLAIPQLLVASHIIPWASREDTRTDPRNGLLLNGIHDKAFDFGLITITEDYKLKLSQYLKDSLPQKIIQEWFINYSGQRITLPDKFLPSREYLRWHNENIFKG